MEEDLPQHTDARASHSQPHFSSFTVPVHTHTLCLCEDSDLPLSLLSGYWTSSENVRGRGKMNGLHCLVPHDGGLVPFVLEGAALPEEARRRFEQDERCHRPLATLDIRSKPECIMCPALASCNPRPGWQGLVPTPACLNATGMEKTRPYPSTSHSVTEAKTKTQS